MGMKTNLLSATVTVLLVSHIAFSMMARAQDGPSNRQQDFEGSTKWVNLPTGYNWVE